MNKKNLKINSIASGLSAQNRISRRRLLAHIIKIGAPCDTQNDACPVSLGEIQSLAEKNAIAMDDEGRIYCIYPVSALETHHQVRLADGRTFFAMCAVDSLGATFAFNQDVDISSKCSHCGLSVQIAIRAKKIAEKTPKDIQVLHVDLKQRENWATSC